MADPSIYDQLAKESLSDLTVTQLNAGSSVTAVDQATVSYWSGPITLARILESSRTYAHGLPIPETGAIEQVAVIAGADSDLQPTGTELWAIKSIFAIANGGTATCNIGFSDGSTSVPIRVGVSVSNTGIPIDLNETIAWPLEISNSLYLNFAETGGVYDVTFFVAYFKVSL